MNLSHLLHSSYTNPLFRHWQSASCKLGPENFIYPVFLSYDPDEFVDITSLPGQKRVGVNHLVSFLTPLVAKSLRCVLLFGTVDADMKDQTGSFCDRDDSPVMTAIRILKKSFSELIVACDVCLCAYTNHGHCGILFEDGRINIESSVQRLSDVSMSFARAGADIVAPSDMTDGRVAAIKTSLRKYGFGNKVAIMSYSAKFASCFYGPFRGAANSAPAFGDRRSYQLPPGSRGLAIRAALRDANEGADFIMVKPGLLYLDIISELRNLLPHHPLAVYHVSGEYVMLKQAADFGVVDLKQASLEIMTAFRRAGATVIITYLTPYLLDLDFDAVCQ